MSSFKNDIISKEENINIFGHRSISLISDISEDSESDKHINNNDNDRNIKQEIIDNKSIIDDDTHNDDDVTFVDEDYHYNDDSPRSTKSLSTIGTIKNNVIAYNENCSKIYLGVDNIHLIFSFIHPQFKMIIHREGTSNDHFRNQKLSIEIIMIADMKKYFEIVVMKYKRTMAKNAARWGRMNALKGLMRYIEPSSDISIAAAKGNRIDVLIWARENSCGWVNTSVFDMSWCEIEKLQKHFRADNCFYDIDVCSEAARMGHFYIVQYAVEQGCPMNWMSCANAAGKGHLEILIYLREKSCSWDGRTYINAITSGNIELIEWVRNNGLNVAINALQIAFEFGHLHVIRYLIDNNFDRWDGNINGHNNLYFRTFTKLAASKGCIESLRWSQSLEQPLPFHIECCHEAASNGFLDCLKWCLDNNCLWYELPASVVVVVENGHLNVLKFLICSRMADWSKNLQSIALNHQQEKIIKWVEKEGLYLE